MSDDKKAKNSKAAFDPSEETEKGNVVISEFAWMAEDGTICVKNVTFYPGGFHAEGEHEILPSDKGYEEAKKDYKLEKPGDRYKNREVKKYEPKQIGKEDVPEDVLAKFLNKTEKGES
jgi:hypothetical protein